MGDVDTTAEVRQERKTDAVIVWFLFFRHLKYRQFYFLPNSWQSICYYVGLRTTAVADLEESPSYSVDVHIILCVHFALKFGKIKVVGYVLNVHER